MYTRVQIASSWQEIVAVDCKHSFYEDNVCRAITMEPTEETKRMLRNYYMIFKPVVGGFKLIGNSPKCLDILQRYYEEGQQIKFSFLMNNTKAEFINFTNLPLGNEGTQKIHHYTTKRGKGKNQLEREVCVKMRQKLVFRTAEILTTKNIQIEDAFGKRHSFETVKDDKYKKVEKWLVPFEGKDTNITITPDSKRENPRTKKMIYSYIVDFKYVPDGEYKIIVGKKKEVFHFYNLTDRVRNFGIVDIYLSDLMTKDGQLQINQNFEISFERRSTLWRYYLVKEKNVKYKGFKFYSLEDEEKPLKTKLAKETKTLNNGKEALIFVSETPLPLKERMKKSFRIEYEKVDYDIEDKNKNITSGKKNMKLPTPKIHAIKPEKNAKNKEEKIYSDIFFYI